MQAYDSIIFEYFCMEFIKFMLNNKMSKDLTDLLSLNNFKENDKRILACFI